LRFAAASRAVSFDQVHHLELAMSTERRKSARRRCLLGARIIVNGGNSTLSCVIRNRSEGGVLLTLPEPMAIASEFPLVVDKHAAAATAVVAWRSGKHVGIAFREEGALDRMTDMAERREADFRRATREASVRQDNGY
jgi:hypothetical protein